MAEEHEPGLRILRRIIFLREKGCLVGTAMTIAGAGEFSWFVFVLCLTTVSSLMFNGDPILSVVGWSFKLPLEVLEQASCSPVSANSFRGKTIRPCGASTNDALVGCRGSP